MHRYAVSPCDARDITKDKRYLITNWAPSIGKYGSFNVCDDKGFPIFCLIGTCCAHIDNKTWTITEDEDETVTIDQVKVIEIGADAIEEVLQASPVTGLAYPPKLMHAVVAALGRHGFIIEDRYEDTGTNDAESSLVSLVAETPVEKEGTP